MRRKRIVLSVVVPLTLIAGIAVPSGAQAQQDPTMVSVNVTCPSELNKGAFTITVEPYEATVKQYQGIQWSLTTDNAANKNLKIGAVDPRKWPYEKNTVEATNKVTMSNMQNSTIDKVYQYKVSVFCESFTEPIVLDPRIRVGGG